MAADNRGSKEKTVASEEATVDFKND